MPVGVFCSPRSGAESWDESQAAGERGSGRKVKRLREFIQDARMLLRRPEVSSSKFIAYFQLLEAFRQPGCPVCRLVEEGALKALDGLMYEQVNDPFTRDRLVESHGLCNCPAWMIPGV